MTEDAVDEMKERKLNAIKDCMFSLAFIDNNRPTGKGKHFRMSGISLTLEEMSEDAPNKDELWKKLRSLVDLELLEEKDEEEKDETDQALDKLLEEQDYFRLPEETAECGTEKADDPKEEKEVPDKPAKPVIKDYTRNRTPKAKPKEEEELDEESDGKLESGPESDEDDTPLKPPKAARRSQTVKKSAPAKKPVPKRNNRSVKERNEKEASPASTSSKKTDDEAPIAKKSTLGKRSLRSRGDEDGYGSSPTHTPPPTTRSRRI